MFEEDALLNSKRAPSENSSDVARVVLRILPPMLLITLCCSAFSRVQAQEPLTPQVILFQQKNIPISPAGIRQALAGLLPAEDGASVAADLIAQLGADEFAVREQAEAKILALPLPPIDQLKQAKVGDDPEIRMRAAKLLKQLEGQKPEQELFLYASLLLMRDELETGMTAELLQLAPHCKRADLCVAAWKAMRRNVQKEDQSRLLKALRSDNSLTCAMACVGLQSLTGADQKPFIQDALAEELPELMQLAFAWGRLDEKLPADKKLLKELAESKEELVQLLAQRTLEQMESGGRKANWSDYLAAKLI